MENNFYVYVYLDNRKPGEWRFNDIIFKFQPFYIGKGKGTRINQHLQPMLLNHNTIKNNKIKSIIRETGELPIHYKIFENLIFEESNLIEISIIKKFGRINLNNGILSNMTDGGEGFKTMIFTDEAKKNMSLSRIKNNQTYSNHGSSKIIEKYDIDGNFLERYNSLREASEKNNLGFKNISVCCRGITKTAYGFKWKYVGSSYLPKIKTECIERRKKVYKYDLSGNYICEYESMSEAEKIEKIKHISSVCLGKLNFSGGFQWKYEKLDSLPPITFEKTKNIKRYLK
jgi:hypothetical protein